MLLRTASEPGSHGINIQDSSTLVEQDRASMLEKINQVTEAVDRGLERDYKMRKVSTVEQSVISTPPTDNLISTAKTVSDPSRRFVIDNSATVSQEVNLNTMLQDMGDLMFRLFMPEWTQLYLRDTSCSVMITTNDLELPWELMHCNGKFLCLDRPTSRMPMGRALPPHKVKSTGSSGRKLRFLLIYSDPENTLPAAKVEIEMLYNQLKDEWKDRIDVTVLYSKDATGNRLNQELRRGNFDVIHYAGHAGFDEKDPDLSGLLVCDRSGNKEIFFTQKIRRLLSSSPGRPLVFLNACQSGRTANEEEVMHTDYLLGPAEGLASAFLYGGALACIGSLWPIFDRPAAEFAVEFYRKALEGYMLGEAMRLARNTIYDKYPDQVTWAAFALYGDATFRLAS